MEADGVRDLPHRHIHRFIRFRIIGDTGGHAWLQCRSSIAHRLELFRVEPELDDSAIRLLEAKIGAGSCDDRTVYTDGFGSYILGTAVSGSTALYAGEGIGDAIILHVVDHKCDIFVFALVQYGRIKVGGFDRSTVPGFAIEIILHFRKHKLPVMPRINFVDGHLNLIAA